MVWECNYCNVTVDRGSISLEKCVSSMPAPDSWSFGKYWNILTVASICMPRFHFISQVAVHVQLTCFVFSSKKRELTTISAQWVSTN